MGPSSNMYKIASAKVRTDQSRQFQASVTSYTAKFSSPLL